MPSVPIWNPLSNATARHHAAYANPAMKNTDAAIAITRRLGGASENVSSQILVSYQLPQAGVDVLAINGDRGPGTVRRLE